MCIRGCVLGLRGLGTYLVGERGSRYFLLGHTVRGSVCVLGRYLQKVLLSSTSQGTVTGQGHAYMHFTHGT